MSTVIVGDVSEIWLLRKAPLQVNIRSRPCMFRHVSMGNANIIPTCSCCYATALSMLATSVNFPGRDGNCTNFLSPHVNCFCSMSFILPSGAEIGWLVVGPKEMTGFLSIFRVFDTIFVKGGVKGAATKVPSGRHVTLRRNY